MDTKLVLPTISLSGGRGLKFCIVDTTNIVSKFMKCLQREFWFQTRTALGKMKDALVLEMVQ